MANETYTLSYTGSEINEKLGKVDELDGKIGGRLVDNHNLLPNNLLSEVVNGITFTINSDKSVTIDGTATYLAYRTMEVTLPAGNYILSGCPASAQSQGYHYMVTRADGSYATVLKDYAFTVESEEIIKIMIRITNGTTVSNITFYPMIRSSDVADSTYMPYGQQIYEGGVFEQIEEVRAIAEEAKELATEANNANSGGTSSASDEDLLNITGYAKTNLLENILETKTSNGITFTVNEDKTITVNGTATALTYVSWQVELQAGQYNLNGLPDTASTSGLHYMITRADGSYSQSANSINGATINITATEVVTIYLRVAKSAVIDNAIVKPMIRPSNVYDNRYVPYGEFNPQTSICSLIDTSKFNWSGKKMNVIGDSIVQGSYGNFANVIGGILNLSEVRNYGIGGCCMASTDQDADYNPVVLRYMDMDDDADIILVHAGTNDFSAQVPLGESDSEEATTFNGALNIIMTGLREKYPDKLIIFSGILHRFNDTANTITCPDYRKAMEERCEANHIIYYDSYKYTGFDFVKGYYDKILTSDGLHPNQKGAEIFGRKLAGFIKWQ